MLTLNSNIASLSVQRQLDRSNLKLRSSLEKLSSGLRIVHASDDAAGLAISSSLTNDSRVYSQAIRNGNDAISVLGTVSGSLSELSSVLIRMKELAEQASNGTLSRSQRVTIDREGAALTSEFNRITASTSFNGLSLLGAGLTNLSIQLGYGSNGSIGMQLGQQISHAQGTGLNAATTYAGGAGEVDGNVLGDFNGDGKLDLALLDANSNEVRISTGDGAGNFTETNTYSNSVSYQRIISTDINGDGRLDLAFNAANSVGYMLGNGNGTFQAEQTISTSGSDGSGSIVSGDFNADGKQDIAVAGGVSNNGRIFYGSSTGLVLGQALTGMSVFTSLTAADTDGDGKAEIIQTNSAGGGNIYSVNGSSLTRTSLAAISGLNTANSAAVGDFNFDGIPDLAVLSSGNNRVGIALGNGDGTFDTAHATTQSLSISAGDITMADLNNDGISDIVGVGASTVAVLYGVGDGTFLAQKSLGASSGGFSGRFSLGDINSDGVLDYVGNAAADTAANISLSTTSNTTNVQRFNLTTQSSARSMLSLITTALNRVEAEIGNIGASESRVFTALSNLFTARENFDSAASQIRDVDVARESAEMVKNGILQRAGTAILANANVQPSLALNILRSSAIR